MGGSIVNRIGVKWTLSIGGAGYCIYAMALLLSVHFSVDGFCIFTGALLGFCAALLWTAQGCIMVAYPHEEDKGKFFGWFWAIFNMGAVIGSLVRCHLCNFEVQSFRLIPEVLEYSHICYFSELFLTTS